jgi:mycothiol synthase
MSATMVHVPGAPAIPGLSFRNASAQDWDRIADLLNEVRKADGIDEVRSGASLAAEYPESETFAIARDVLLAEVNGRLVAYASGHRVIRDGSLVGQTDCLVHPAYRRMRLGTAIHQATVERLRAEFAADPRPGPRQLRAWGLEEEAGNRALLAEQGFVPVRYGFVMRRSLTGVLPERPLPDGIELRPVTEDQFRAIFDANNEAFEDHWGHREPTEADFKAHFQAPDIDPAIWCVAWDGDQVAGVVMNTIMAGENEALGIRRGWLDQVSVRRPWRGLGLGKALCTASFRVLRDLGMDEAWLGVDGTNPTGALQLYEGLGFLAHHRWTAFGRPLDGPALAGWTPEVAAAEVPAGRA